MARHPGRAVQLRLEGKLAFVSVTLEFASKRLALEQVLLDTGSAGTVFGADAVRSLGIKPEGNDKIKRILGVGGTEFVYSKRIERLAVGQMIVEDFEIQVGAKGFSAGRAGARQATRGPSSTSSQSSCRVRSAESKISISKPLALI